MDVQQTHALEGIIHAADRRFIPLLHKHRLKRSEMPWLMIASLEDPGRPAGVIQDIRNGGYETLPLYRSV